MRSSLFRRTAFLVLCSSGVDAQQPQPKELLAHALHLADLYNWDDAGPLFAEAERLFVAEGDQSKTGVINARLRLGETPLLALQIRRIFHHPLREK